MKKLLLLLLFVPMVSFGQQSANELFNSGIAKYDLKDYQGAIPGYAKSIELDPGSRNVGVSFENAYVIKNINVVDPIQGLQENKTVVIGDNKIIGIYDASILDLSNNNLVYDASGKYLIPGLWDSHVHYAYDEDFTDHMSNLFLAHGITSVRDTGGEIKLLKGIKDEALKDPKNNPRIMIAGPLIDGKFNVYDGNSPKFPPLSIQTSNTQHLIEQVNALIEQDVDFLKAYEMLTPLQFETLANIAKENNLKLTGHVPLSMDVSTASDLGLNSMEHFRNLELSTALNFEELWVERKSLLKNKLNLIGSSLRRSIHQKQRMKAIYATDSTKLKAVVAVLKKNNTWQIPTLALYQNYARRNYQSPSYLEKFKVIPEVIETRWREKIKQSSTDPNIEMENYTDWSKSIMEYMHKEGIQFMAGTDTPIGYLIPGLSLHQELVFMSNSNLSNLELLKAATYNPAKYFNLQDSLGRILPGHIADLIILDQNPLEEIKNTEHIYAVIKDGNYMSRNHLDSLLQRENSSN